MQATFKINGMSCQGCVDTIEKGLRGNSSINMAIVSLENNELTIESNQHLSSEQIDSILSSSGNYSVVKDNPSLFSKIISHLVSKKPILLALLVVVVSSLSLQTAYGTFDLNN